VRTMLELDDELVAEAQRLTGTSDLSALVEQALRTFVEQQSVRRLARLGGTDPDADAPARRRDRSL
jgi:Arc/MetJ family transcription regulator